MQELLLDADCFLPSKRRTVSDVCAQAALEGADNRVRNGIDRAHPIYGDAGNAQLCAPGSAITYRFPAGAVESVHLVFDSDLNRKTLPGSWVEQARCMRANQRLDHPQTALPNTLCKAFTLTGYLKGEEVFSLQVEENRKRAHHIKTGQTFDALVLTLKESWGDENIPVISFDFK